MTDLAHQLIAHEKKEKTGKLDLGKCGLTELPKELFELEWLEELTLSNWRRNVEGQLIESSNSGSNNLLQENLPEDFKKLKQLKKLYLRGIYDVEAIQRTDNWAGLIACDKRNSSLSLSDFYHPILNQNEKSICFLLPRISCTGKNFRNT